MITPTETATTAERAVGAPRAAAALDRSRPALVLDGGGRGDLGVVRSLGAAGVPVTLLVQHESSVVARSRHVGRRVAMPAVSADDAVRLDALRRAAAAERSRPALFIGGDHGLRFVTRHRAAIAEVAELDLAPPEVVEACLHKDRFAPLAAAAGVPVPATLSAPSAAALAERIHTLTFPVFVKATHRSHWEGIPASVIAQPKGFRVDTPAALLRLYEALAASGMPGAVSATIVQEYVPGPDDAHYDVHAYRDPDVGVTRAFVGRKLRIYPPHAGIGAYVVSAWEPAAAAAATAILDALDYAGIANMNFKRDERTGEFRLLEINCRYSMWTELPMRAGCNMPLAGYAAMTGQRLPPARQRDGVAWWDLHRDLSALRTYRREGGWPWGEYLRSLRRVRCGAFFALDDLGPFVQQLLSRSGS